MAGSGPAAARVAGVWYKVRETVTGRARAAAEREELQGDGDA